MSATYRVTFLHLVVSEYSTECRAPVHSSLTLVCDTILHEDSCLLLLIKSIPLLSCEGFHFAACRIDSRISTFSECSLKFSNRTSLLLHIIIPAAEHLEECPLSPLVIFRIAGTHLT